MFLNLDISTYYINFQFSNLDGKGDADLLLQREGFPDETLTIPVNAVVGHVVQMVGDKKPGPVKVSAKDRTNGNTILIDGDSVHQVEFLDEPTPVYVALGNGATGKLS